MVCLYFLEDRKYLLYEKYSIKVACLKSHQTHRHNKLISTINKAFHLKFYLNMVLPTSRNTFFCCCCYMKLLSIVKNRLLFRTSDKTVNCFANKRQKITGGLNLIVWSKLSFIWFFFAAVPCITPRKYLNVLLFYLHSSRH